MLGRCLVAFILHLKHDRDDLVASNISFTIDIIALTASASVIVFFKVGRWKRSGSEFVKFRLTVLLERFTNHLS
ncbi:hypothetical protein D3C72_850310 [compost metagenome]